jgi:predicted ATP-dependent endonuclease of OLD family
MFNGEHNNISNHLDSFIPEIIFWKPDEKHLITEHVSLKAFSQNPDSSLPLKNIFHIYGKIQNNEISDTISKALKSPERKAELQDTLSEKVTKHVNDIWKEHKVNFKFTIDGDLLNTVVEDKLKKYRYFNMKQRSEGFKQFTSMILSLSAKNTGDTLDNNVILIDEPETHLHPSGIQYMRKELLKIGKKNQVLISTHSNFMIDTSTMDRHWIMEKDTESKIHRVDENKSLHDEEVVSRAFGIEIMKELLPKNILIVEGKCDKIVIEMLLNHFGENISYSVKNAGGCSKVYSVASILAAEDFSPFVFLDSDDEGIKAKNDILKNLKENYTRNTVKTINDLGYSVTNKASIEDLYPRNLVKSFLLEEHKIDIDTHKDKPVIETIKILDDSFKNKEKQTKLKTNLSEKFLLDYNNKELLEKDAPELIKVGKKLIELLDK